MTLPVKPFLTTAEAANLACVSLSQFKRLSPGLGIKSCLWMGKRVYRSADIVDIMNSTWLLSNGEVKTGILPISHGPKTARKNGSALAKLPGRNKAFRGFNTVDNCRVDVKAINGPLMDYWLSNL